MDITILYPVLDIGDKLPLEPLWSSAIGFVIIFVVLVTAIGLSSKTLSVGASGGYLTFVHFAVEADIQLLSNIMYVTIALVILSVSFKIWKLEGI